MDLGGNLQSLDLGQAALKLNALPGRIRLDSLQLFEEIQMPEAAPELAIGDAIQSDRVLLGD